MRERRLRETLGRDVQLAGGRGQEILRQLRHVGQALAQRRQLQAHHVDPMQQVRTEASLGDQRFQVLVGGRDHPHVDPDEFAPADPEEFAFRQYAQETRLQRQRHVADFIQEQGAAIGLLETADVALLRAGEGAGLVAEQFALQQFGGNGGGVERDEGLARARRFLVQRAGNELLAGTGFAIDQHRQRRLRQPADGAEQRAHRRRVADQVRRALRRSAGLGRGRSFLFGIRQRARGQRDRVVQIEGLGQELVRAPAECAGGAGDVGIGGHHDHRQLRVRGLQPVQQDQPVVTRHAHVGEQQVRRAARTQRLQGGGGAVETVDVVAGIAQRRGQDEAHRAVVVDHPDALCRGRSEISGHGVPLPRRHPAATTG